MSIDWIIIVWNKRQNGWTDQPVVACGINLPDPMKVLTGRSLKILPQNKSDLNTKLKSTNENKKNC